MLSLLTIAAAVKLFLYIFHIIYILMDYNWCWIFVLGYAAKNIYTFCYSIQIMNISSFLNLPMLVHLSSVYQSGIVPVCYQLGQLRLCDVFSLVSLLMPGWTSVKTKNLKAKPKHTITWFIQVSVMMIFFLLTCETPISHSHLHDTAHDSCLLWDVMYDKVWS